MPATGPLNSSLPNFANGALERPACGNSVETAGPAVAECISVAPAPLSLPPKSAVHERAMIYHEPVIR